METRNLAEGLERKAQIANRSGKELIKKLKKKVPFDLDETVHQVHDRIFSMVNCLECANCCRTLGPRITDRDIDRLSKAFKVKPSAFTGKYLKLDEDNDYVFNQMPCPFLGSDNMCSVYDIRPKACREYPHTDRKKFSQLLDLTLKNTYTCPAAYAIIEELKQHYSKTL